MALQKVPISSTRCNHERYEKLQKLAAVEENAAMDTFQSRRSPRSRKQVPPSC